MLCGTLSCVAQGQKLIDRWHERTVIYKVYKDCLYDMGKKWENWGGNSNMQVVHNVCTASRLKAWLILLRWYIGFGGGGVGVLCWPPRLRFLFCFSSSSSSSDLDTQVNLALHLTKTSKDVPFHQASLVNPIRDRFPTESYQAWEAEKGILILIQPADCIWI